jgi:dephospho-CoA kinase
VVVIGLTGGIGSGKSTVAGMLVERGAHLVDADQIARDVVEPGQPALAALVERFGDGILDADGRLDRAALAAVAFVDDDARKALNGITHPAIGAEMLRRLGAVQEEDPEGVAVLDIPLLAEGGRERYALQGVIVVDTPVDVAVERLVRLRGFDEADARARVAAQATREERRAIADVVIDNSGAANDLVEQVDAAWAWARGLAAQAG